MIELVRTTSTDPVFGALFRQLDAELKQIYGEVQDQYAVYNVFVCDTVLLARLDGVPVGCGCFKGFGEPGTVELKRMFVAPGFRQRGVAGVLLGGLEAWARELGYTTMVLETGTRQEAAIQLYRARGYAVIPNFGPYQDLPFSVCMRKAL